MIIELGVTCQPKHYSFIKSSFLNVWHANSIKLVNTLKVKQQAKNMTWVDYLTTQNYKWNLSRSNDSCKTTDLAPRVVGRLFDRNSVMYPLDLGLRNSTRRTLELHRLVFCLGVDLWLNRKVRFRWKQTQSFVIYEFSMNSIF